ncbi:MAG: Sir2 silent information regulator family NAD-dependent deacetylase [Lachnospiraceae bacterium]|nr:Sir2 silent information regulator family NAD-dependent deacetylase [Lachnospiraceae bacterium]MBR4332856.1 Sir2 silent information regulator family NAD-dependent deacetylase [Clostridia bacterium]MBR6706815.1 Sir2 silent information regulator family NAD-dependent deacetylase [Clostridia bacterium]
MEKKIQELKEHIQQADAVIIGAGAGLSTAAGFVYSGERFDRYFSDFSRKYGFCDMYSGGFYPYETREEFWAYWSRYIWVNRYMDAPKNTYADLFRLVRDKDYFVLTTNVDHCFQKAGFDKKRLFYTQGDYGLFQCSKPCCKKTWENYPTIRSMILAQGFIIGEDNGLTLPDGAAAAMRIPTELLPKCPVCGRPLIMNLRSDDKFVEDEGWQKAAVEYEAWLTAHRDKRVVFLEIGVGYNTPGIIKYSFWQQVYQNENAAYACLNMEALPVPKEIRDRSVVIGGDSAQVIRELVS